MIILVDWSSTELGWDTRKCRKNIKISWKARPDVVIAGPAIGLLIEAIGEVGGPHEKVGHLEIW